MGLKTHLSWKSSLKFGQDEIFFGEFYKFFVSETLKLRIWPQLRPKCLCYWVGKIPKKKTKNGETTTSKISKSAKEKTQGFKNKLNKHKGIEKINVVFN